jgi:hypothetical protein
MWCIEIKLSGFSTGRRSLGILQGPPQIQLPASQLFKQTHWHLVRLSWLALEVAFFNVPQALPLKYLPTDGHASPAHLTLTITSLI